MANSERSFRDRENKARDLCNAITGFTPAFAPPNAAINVANFTLLVAQAKTVNDTVDGISGTYTTDAQTRTDLIKTVRKRVTQALSYIKSNTAWKSSCKAAKMAADKLRGIHPPGPKLPPPPPEGGASPEEEKRRNKGEMAYLELEGHFRKFVGVCEDAPGYAPTAAEITLGTLNGLLSQLSGLNQSLSVQGTQLTKAQQERLILYYQENGLEEKFQLVKAAVKGQYGQAGANYAAVKGMKW